MGSERSDAAISVGVDLASQARTTALCALAWSAGRARVLALDEDVDDDAIVERARAADALGIDAPFGWPQAFIDFTNAHHAQQPLPAQWRYRERMQALRFRRTDLALQPRTGLKRPPLSVSSDRIALPALRCAGLLDRLAVRDRAGLEQPVYEVYPALALHQWLGWSESYKQSNGPAQRAHGRAQRQRICARLRERAPWLELSAAEAEAVTASDHRLDALLAALLARAARCGLCEPIPDDDVAAARVEGWIAIPARDALTRLGSARSVDSVGRIGG
ncbi:DUF429 domain-containing protein [Haliangium ochraceum]|uniref:DUF429 domain-containing protein n=1 Tax=Haliangium ochraceum (strain DSM 14365 / JCM 11303 / SMP-2) TaxID=502025 RepID=D0LWH1_HALO1|nr:DUF429 domain-containing protein [Haliangium ochraceum]ACY17621.1 conserved hypothetical protein [Haliangium ochraceum DSM 14365]